MKTRKILAIAIITIMFLALFIGTVSAIAVSVFMITSGQYSGGNRINFDAEVRELNVNDTLQLNTVIAYGEDRPGGSNSAGWTVVEADVEVLAWTSSDTTVATVSSTGLVTGKKAGTTTITATTKDPTTDGDPESIKTATVEITVNPSTAPVAPGFYDFSDAKIEMVKEMDVLFYDANMYVTGIDTEKVKAYKQEHNSRFYLYVSDKAGTTIPTKYNDITDMFKYGDEISYPAVFNLELLDNNKLEVSGNMNELYAKLGDTLYATILESYSDPNDPTVKLHATKEDTKITKPAQEAYGNKIKFTIHDTWTYMAVNEPSSANQKKMEMKVAKVNSISKYTSENKYTNLMADLKSATSFLYDKQITFDRHGSGGTNAENKELTTSSINFEKGSYYLVYAKLLGEGKYNEVEDAELYYFNGMNLQPVTEFNENKSATGGNVVATNTTNPTNTSGDISIATKKIPQTGATPVFAIVLGSVVLVTGLLVVANKKYRNIK